jgi:DNA-binding transcriptional LysR family regulator
MLDWDDLRFFLAVVRAGSLSAAARTLAVTQPTVGRRIAALERKLGAKLFLQSPSGQTPSKTGQMISSYAEQMEVEALSAERIASGRDAGLRGRVCITASEWMIGRVLGPLVGPFLAQHRELELDLLADERLLSLLRREADIALRISRFEQQDVVQREVGVVSFGLYAADTYLAQHGMPDFARQCQGHSLVAMSEHLKKIPDVDWLPSFASRARIAVRTNGREPMASMAAAGFGLACLPRFIGDHSPSLRLLPTPTPGPERRLWLGTSADARSVPRVKATAAFLSAAIGRLRTMLCPTVGGAKVSAK